MESSTGWFILLAALTGVATWLGHIVGQGSARRAGVWMCFGAGMLVLWCWLFNHPSVAVLVIPPSVLRYVEGVGGAPFFMFCNAIAWNRSGKVRQRRLAELAMAVGVVYFAHGGLWMLQSTPQSAMAQDSTSGDVLQSQDYSCVPAACATALNRLGFRTSEAQMARLTETRVGNGATDIRALDGLNRRLRETNTEARLLAVSLDEVKHLTMPVLTTLQFEKSRGHMVVIVRIDSRGAMVVDPTDGTMWMSLPSLREVYRGEVIAFDRQARAGLLVASTVNR